MTKSELIEQVSDKTGLTKMKAEKVVNTVFDSMVSSLERGEGIEIRGFGSFTVRHYKSYAGRNPRTGQQVEVPEKRLPFFKVGKELKSLVNEGLPELPSIPPRPKEVDTFANQGSESGKNKDRTPPSRF